VFLVRPTLPTPEPYLLAVPLVAFALTLLAGVQVIAWTRNRPGVVAVGGVFVAVVVNLAPLAARALSGHATVRGVLDPALLRTQHLLIALAIFVLVAATLAYLARLAPPRLAGRVPWLDALAAARSEPGMPDVSDGSDGAHLVLLARGGELGEQASLRIVAGARYWSRKQRWIVVVGVAGATLRARAISSGWGVEVRAVGDAVATADWPSTVPDAAGSTSSGATTEIVFGERVTLTSAPGVSLDDSRLQVVWRELIAYVLGGLPGREAGVVSVRLERGELAQAVVRWRKRGGP